MAPQSTESANAGGVLSEESTAIESAERYLSDWAYNSYMYMTNDLNVGTVLDTNVDEADLAAVMEEISAMDNSNDEFHSDAVGGQVNSAAVMAEKLKKNMQFMKDKAVYFSEIRQYNGLQRTNFKVEYAVQNAVVQGNLSIIDILENISFHYVGVKDPSFSQEEHTVYLVKAGGEWIVANIETKYGWFDEEYKDTTYKLSSLIEAEKQTIQAQAVNSANVNLAEIEAATEEESATEAEIIANAAYVRSYNKDNAWKYAYTYTTSTATSNPNSYYNEAVFNDYSGPKAGDCMNFASQSIYAGFAGSNSLDQVKAGAAPQDTVGLEKNQTNAEKTKWFGRPSETYWAWTSCSYFRNYIDYSASDDGTRLYAVKKSISASSDFSEVGTANLIGSIIHVNGTATLGHAVVVNATTGTARNQIYYSAHSPNSKNLNLADKYSGAMVSIRPVFFYDITACTGTYASHTFSETNSKCTRCGYVRTYITPTLLSPVEKNTKVTLTAKTNHTVLSIAMSVTNPKGETKTFTSETNTNSISRTYTPTVASYPDDLYTVTVTAVSGDDVTTTSIWTFRTY